MGELMEARLIDAFPMDDGMDDGFQPDKSQDGDEETLVINQHSRGGTPGAGNPEAPQNRAARRARNGG
jgi:hypothetical protein